jgi:hypothetical protein
MSQPPRGQRRSPEAVVRQRFFRSLLQAQRRERERLLHEVLEVRGLMPLLMKQRNGVPWTPQERQQLKERLHALSKLSPYLVVLALPGSLLMLPLLAWWLDRRRSRR